MNSTIRKKPQFLGLFLSDTNGKNYRTIYIYDTAKGGAGYASQFSIFTDKIIDKAFKVLDQCNCQSACTKCLVDRNSQWNIEDLNRYTAKEWLQEAKRSRLPENIENSEYDIRTFFGSLKDQVNRMNYHYTIEEMNIHFSDDIANWASDQESLQWFDRYKRKGTKVNFVMEGELPDLENQEKISLHILKNDFNLKQGENDTIVEIPVQLSLRLKNGEEIIYISDADYQNLQEDWDDNFEAPCYEVRQQRRTEYSNLVLPDFSTVGQLFESRIGNIPQNTKSNELVDLMLNNLSDPQDFIDKITNESYHVSYIDKFNQSELSMRLMLQFVERLMKKANLNIRSLKVYLSDNDFKGNDYPRRIYENYKNVDDYNDDLQELADSYPFPINLNRLKKLPHYRYFEFKSAKQSFQIRIDAGIAHGIFFDGFIDSEKENTMEKGAFKIKKHNYATYDLIYNITID